MAMVKGFENCKVKISRNTHKNVPNPYNTWQPILPKNIENPLAPKVKDEYQEEFLDADLVVFAMGGRPDDSLYFALQEAHASPEIYNIGDSFAAGRVLEANRAAYNLAVKL
jgi:2-enoate reductase